jgi:REP element-mobilizing transposase RayT
VNIAVIANRTQNNREYEGRLTVINLPVRKHPRLKGYDYSQSGAYFMTFCIKDKEELLGRVDVGRGIPDAPFVELSEYGKVLKDTIEFTRKKTIEIEITKYVIMPNHVHLIVMIDSVSNGASRMPRPTNALIPKLISSIKRFTNKQIGFNIWQRSFHDHIIRSHDEYLRIWKYIDENPLLWSDDIYFIQPP